jgi:general secretion pathway protein B
LLVVLLVNAVLLAYALWPDPASESRGATDSVPGAPAVPAPPRAAQSTETPTPAPQVAPRVAEPVATISGAAVYPPARPVGPSTPRQLPPRPDPEPEHETLRLLPPLPPRPAAAARETVAAGPPPAPSAPADDNLPVWPRIPSQLFRQINSELRLDVHVYSEQPQERFVLINMMKYGEGDQLQEGPVVDAITTDGVILSFHGQRFQLRSQ